MKHNKYENVGVLYEALCTAVLKEISNNNNDKAKNIMEIITKYFISESSIQKTWSVYHQLLYSESINYFYANRFINSLIKEYRNINKQDLYEDMNNLYEDISKFYSVKNIMNIKTPNYRLFASFKTLAEQGNRLKTTDKISCETMIAEHLVENKESKRIKESKEIFSDQISDFDYQTNKLAETIAIKKFEEKYRNSLNEDQKEFLVKYISSSDNNNFNNWLKKRIKNVVNEIKSFNDTNINTEIKEKLYLVSEKLDNFTKKEDIKDKDLVTVLMSLKLRDSLNLFNN